MQERQIVDQIERAHDAQLNCSCGRRTAPVSRNGAIWLECTSFSEPRTGLVQRAMAVLTAPGHVRRHIVDVPQQAQEVAGAA